jgi:hypothetical protein
MVASWGNRLPIVRTVQRGTFATAAGTSATATITAVDTNNAELVLLGTSQTDANANAAVMFGRATLTNGTTITGTIGFAGTVTFSYEVMEYFPGWFKSVQRGTIAIGAATSATATVTSVNILKSRLTWQGYSMTTAASVTTDIWAVKEVLTNGTTITGSRATGDANNPPTLSYQLLEHYL